MNSQRLKLSARFVLPHFFGCILWNHRREKKGNSFSFFPERTVISIVCAFVNPLLFIYDCIAVWCRVEDTHELDWWEDNAEQLPWFPQYIGDFLFFSFFGACGVVINNWNFVMVCGSVWVWCMMIYSLCRKIDDISFLYFSIICIFPFFFLFLCKRICNLFLDSFFPWEGVCGSEFCWWNHNLLLSSL